ncbi:DUF711 family protein [Halieaceae bacterium IMCC14734]|uniref:DUF711 family protein n=1 Tax=Candidatus Litorirhabdus singularis TaxID=2518993 RepID=A0ABT3TP39_9GAMM|nr:DUF711 family protein [Candidatus Litorirhabdus singularis]MCX2983159.1 DUF711 family protein [Candidatus Litorirhabdus singularis]
MSRRSFMNLVGAAALSSGTLAAGAGGFRVRTITAGVELGGRDDLPRLDQAAAFLERGKALFGEQWEVQTTRIATQPLAQYLPDWRQPQAMAKLVELDNWAQARNNMLSVGPVLTGTENAQGFGEWAAELVTRTANTSFSCFAAAPGAGPQPETINASAEAIVAIAANTPGGEGNFRFCATANCPSGTPFFPAAWHSGEPAFTIGLESPLVLLAALQDAESPIGMDQRLRAALNRSLAPVDALARQLASDTGWHYRGIDTSPAPGLQSSIGAVIERVSGVPFGAPGTLQACAKITAVLKDLDVMTSGYCGLMLPVLEDTVLAQRADEGRYSVQELLLYSSVCGTGLDVVPVPGDSSVSTIAAIITDMAALSVRYTKPLSVRLFPVPGKAAGERVEFNNPHLTACNVMPLG